MVMPVSVHRHKHSFPWSRANIVFDGNSLMRGGYSPAGTQLPNQVAARTPVLGTGAPMTNCGVNGQTWKNMNGLGGYSSSDVDGAWVDGKANLLIIWEGTNSICNPPVVTATQAAADAAAYIAARRALHPWIIVLLTTIPREGNSTLMADQAGRNEYNARLVEYDNYLRANYKSMGADVLVDCRPPGGIFNFTGYTPADFDTAAACWTDLETTPNRTHLSGAGLAVIGGYVAAALKTLPRTPHQ